MRRGNRARRPSPLLVALAAGLAMGLASAAEARGGIDGETKPFPGTSLAWAGRNPESLSPGRGALRPRGSIPLPFRLTLPPPYSLRDGHSVPVVSVRDPRRFGPFLLRLSLPDPKVYGPADADIGESPSGRPAAHNRNAEIRSRTLLKYNVSHRIDFVGEAQGSRLRMLRLTLVRLFGGVRDGGRTSPGRFAALSESEAAVLRARERTVRRALAPRLTFPGLSLNLGGISVQAGVRVRLF